MVFSYGKEYRNMKKQHKSSTRKIKPDKQVVGLLLTQCGLIGHIARLSDDLTTKFTSVFIISYFMNRFGRNMG